MRRFARVCVLLVVGCSGPVPKPTPAPEPTPAPAPEPAKPDDHSRIGQGMSHAPVKMDLAQAGIVPSWIDKDADACSDFFAYACGGFLKSAEIPSDRSSWGAPQIVTKEGEDFLRKILEDAAANKSSSDPVTAKLGAYYAACMDEAAIEKAGITPIQPFLDVIASVKDGPTAARAVIALHVAGSDPFFGIGPTQDAIDATKVIASFDQDGLGLPEKKYYVENGGTMPATRKAYTAHLARTFQLVGKDAKQAMQAANNVMRIETAIAKAQQDQVTRRDPHAVYHRVERAGLEKLAPSFPWGDYLKEMGIPDVTAITVNSPAYFTAVATMIRTESPAALRDYLTASLMRTSSDLLSKAFVDEAFTMAKELSGVKELPPRWRRCFQGADHHLGELLAQSYVTAKFAGDSKDRAVQLTKEVLGAMRVELDQLSWMDDTTRVAAKTKLDKMAYLVGFPDKWRRYDFEITRGEYAKNVQAARHFEETRQLSKIGKPVDRFDWGMTPPTVNAYYDPSLNELALPAGQLQPPFFGARFHPAVNFGSTGGGTIGHEMTHGFDDEGSQFDADGNLRDWWSKSTTTKFKAATKCVVDQYAKYEAVPGVNVNGKLTAGENIADIGGVKLAYQAYQTWKTSQKQPVQTDVDGMSDDQLYYLAYAQSWCVKLTPQAAETQAHANPHSPPKWRVNGVIVNQPGFGTAWKCKAGTPMNPGPDKQCKVW